KRIAPNGKEHIVFLLQVQIGRPLLKKATEPKSCLLIWIHLPRFPVPDVPRAVADLDTKLVPRDLVLVSRLPQLGAFHAVGNDRARRERECTVRVREIPLCSVTSCVLPYLWVPSKWSLKADTPGFPPMFKLNNVGSFSCGIIMRHHSALPCL